MSLIIHDQDDVEEFGLEIEESFDDYAHRERVRRQVMSK